MMIQKKAAFVLLFLALLTGCQKTEQTETTAPQIETTYATEATETVATAPVPVQKWISQEQAMLEGFVVIQDGDVRHNQNRWQLYMETVERKEPASITVIHFLRTDAGWEQIRYDISFDGNVHHLTCTEKGEKTEKTYTQLLKQQISLDESREPYDSAIRYLLANNDIGDMLFEDLIAETELDGVTEIAFHLKEGEPALETFTDSAQVDAVLSLLNHAEYLSGDPESYYYGAKLIMINGKCEQLVLELDLNRGNYRYGMQT